MRGCQPPMTRWLLAAHVFTNENAMKRNNSLNHVFRLIWNQATGAWVAVAETTRGRGKASSVNSSVASAVLGAASLGLMLLGAPARAAPQGGQVTAGSASVSQSGATTTISQSSQNVSLSWQSFNIGKSETVNFVQPSASAIAVNRIFDTNGSQIFGHLNANGQVWLINPNGMLFGRDAQVNVGGLVASTLDVADGDLANGTRRFAGSSTAGVINQGRISATEGGSVVLLGHHVSNTGTISARLGTVALGAGNATTLQFEGNRLVNLRVDDNVLDALADNGGLLQADGGQVLMSAGARNSVLASVVNNTGVVEARTVEQSAGRIVLLGGMAAGTTHVAGTLDASAPEGGNGGFIETSAHRVQVADGTRITTAAPHGRTGTWLIDPSDITIAAEGGDITGAALSTQLINNDVVIQSSSGASGSAGDINVNDAVSWSDNTLTLSADHDIHLNASLSGTTADAHLALEYGQSALALGNTAQVHYTVAPSLTAGSTVSTQLGSDVSATVYQVITALDALQGIGADLTGNYALGANVDATATAGWNAGAGFAPIGSEAARYSGNFNGLGHTIGHLTINRSSENNVGLFGASDTGSSISHVGLTDAAITGATTVGALVGDNKGTITDSYATGSVSGAGDYAGGLVGINSSTISNSYATGSVIGTDNVGGLVGENRGTIANSYATGGGVDPRDLLLTAISSGNLPGFISGNDNVGGLVGHNSGAITDSYAANNVSGNNNVGGLVGHNEGGISTSYAAGSGLSGPLLDYIASLGLTQIDELTASVRGNIAVGGLVGLNEGSIADSYATGSVSGSKDKVGGLVGDNRSSIERAYASGSVLSTNGEALLGGLVGTNSGTVSDSLWDIDTTGHEVGIGGGGAQTGVTGLSNNLDLSPKKALTQDSYAGFDFDSTWYMVDGSTRPFLRMEYSTTISNAHQLQLIGMDLTAHYTLANDINLRAELANASGMWGANFAGFAPIGDTTTAFSGSFDGQGHTISHLTIHRSDTDGVGLFGYTGAGSEIRNVGLTDAAITGAANVGALVGAHEGDISNSYATGSVSGNTYVGGLVGYSFDGSISSSDAAVSVSATGDYVGGLVGVNETGTISNSDATGSVSGISASKVGGLVGFNNGGTITNTYATGSVSGTDYVGGLVGDNYGGTVTNSYATGSGSGTNYVGGLVGFNRTRTSTISNSYATGSVTGSEYVGGLVGFNRTGTISNSYATGSASGTSYVGGLVGFNNCGTITNTYATGSVGGSTQVGGLVGYNSAGTVTNNLWDVDTTGQDNGVGNVANGSSGATGLSTTELLNLDNYTTANGNPNWDFTNTWYLVDGSTRPFLRMEYRTTITNAHQLQLMAMDRTAKYTLANNIDLAAELNNASGMWGGLARVDSAGFAPIGTFDKYDFSKGFTGSFDGQGHTIAHLTIHRNTDFVGLFGFASYGSTISNVGMTDVAITGNESVGGLVGDNDGAISNSYATGSVRGTQYVGGLVGINYDGSISNSYATASASGSTSVGGLVGDNRSSITNSYATGSVSGSQNVGGLVGDNSSSGNDAPTGTISNSYATGSVVGSSDVGGLVGNNSNSGSVTHSYWDIETTGQSVGIGLGDQSGATPLLTADALQHGSYADFDFGTTWYMVDGSTRPFLRMEYSTTISNAHQLQLMGMDLGAHYTLANSIDLAAELANVSGMWGGSAAGFAPIGGIGSILPNILGADFANRTALMNGSSPDLSALGNWATATASVNAMSVLDGLGVFTGSLDGQGHSIGHLTINRLDTLSLDSIGVGLFGAAIGADIRNVNLTDASVVGLLGAGGLVGINALGRISDSSVSGQVGGLALAGGLVGLQLAGTITGSHASGNFVGLLGAGGLVGGQALSLVQNSYASGTVFGLLGAGGLVGINLLGAVSTSYSDAAVNGALFVGGLVGINIGLVDNSYATGSVYGGDYVGGLVGGNPGLIHNSYASGHVQGEGGAGHVGGLAGGNLGVVIGSYWDIESSHQEFGIGTEAEHQSGVKGLSTDEALTHDGYGNVVPQIAPVAGYGGLEGYGSLEVDAGLDFTHTWYMVEGSTRPFLRMEHSTTISNAHQLQLMGMDPAALKAHYTLANSIDLGPELASASGMWGANSAGFAPIGDNVTAFTGSFDGQGHTIGHLTIQRSSTDFVGLFGYTAAGSAISNVGLTEVDITGSLEVGGLAGISFGSITNSYATGSVSGIGQVGGLVGDNLGAITNSYATGSVNGSVSVGGLVGANGGAVSNSYATGSVSGSDDYVGGLVGYSFGTVSDSYWDIETTGQSAGIGGGGDQTGVTGLSNNLDLSPKKALTQDSYAGFDFNNTWYMVDGSTRPFLRMEYSTTISNAHQLQLIGMDLTAHYTLANDINLGELNNASSMWGGSAAGFAPIGDTTTAFSGSFDGQGHTISHLTIHRTDLVGLFGVSGVGAEISNVSLTDLDVSGQQYVGGLVGANHGSISHSDATGSVSGGDDVGGLAGFNAGTLDDGHFDGHVSGAGDVGGLVGRLALGSISHSDAKGEVSGDNNVGGLVGTNLIGHISASHASSAVSATQSQAGGLVGTNAGGNIDDSFATGEVSGSDAVGGLVGTMGYDYFAERAGTITGSYATGNVRGTESVGGLVGLNLAGTLSASYAAGAVSGVSAIGGLVGSNLAGSISDSYASGAVSGDTAVGGLVGSNGEGGDGFNVNLCSVNARCGIPSIATISNSYATGRVSVSGGEGVGVGGLVGINNDAGSITRSYWNIATTGQAKGVGNVANEDSGATGLSTGAALKQASYNDWDFTNTWVIYEGHTAPLLRSFMTALTVTVDYGTDATMVWDGTDVYRGGTVAGYSLGDTDTERIHGDLTGTMSSRRVGTRTVTAGGGLYSDQQGYIISYAISGNPTVEVTAPPRLPDEVSAVTTQLASLEPVFKPDKVAPPVSRSGPLVRLIGSAVRLPDNAVTSETTE